MPSRLRTKHVISGFLCAMYRTIILAVATAPLVAIAANLSCPPEGFDSISGFDLDGFISKRWYVQQQMETKYFPASQNRCVYNEYKQRKKRVLGYELVVHNHLQDVNPPNKVHDSSIVCAKIDDRTRGRFRMAPCVMPPAAGAPFWVLAYDPASGFALISGGAPKIASEGGCKTGSGAKDAGLWILTSKQPRDEDLVQKVRAIAAQKGFDLSVLNDVDQSDCSSTMPVDLPVVV